MVFKVDVLSELKKIGYSSYRMSKENIFGSTELQNFRKGKVTSPVTLDRLCELLDCQPDDLIMYVPDE